MKIIGLVGGIASGKSLVADEFGRLGAERLDADQAGHDLLNTPKIRAQLVARWGESVLGPDATIDRAAVSRIVFDDSPNAATERRFLEQRLHPMIRRRLEEEARIMDAQGVRAAVLDAPLLIEAGWIPLCHHLVFVAAPRAVRVHRAERRGWSASEFQAREASQANLDQKRAVADAVIDNSSTPAETRRQVQTLWNRWIGPD